jgi:hypothetical protein
MNGDPSRSQQEELKAFWTGGTDPHLLKEPSDRARTVPRHLRHPISLSNLVGGDRLQLIACSLSDGMDLAARMSNRGARVQVAAGL